MRRARIPLVGSLLGVVVTLPPHTATIMRTRSSDILDSILSDWDNADFSSSVNIDDDFQDTFDPCQHQTAGKLFLEFQISISLEWIESNTYRLDNYNEIAHTTCDELLKYTPEFLQQKQNIFGPTINSRYPQMLFGLETKETNKKKRVKLLQAMDRLKDQTFFMSQVSQKALQHTMFPLGNFTKEVVRKIAESGGLSRVAHKRDSTGICFIGSRNFQDFIVQYIEDTPGKFIDLDTGEEIGEHKGFHYWTVGQNCHLSGMWKRYFIAEKHPETGNISVVAGSEHPALYTSSMLTGQMHWIHKPPNQLYTNGQLECHFRFQHGLPLIPCVVTTDDSNPWHRSPSLNNMRVLLAEPVRAITPGQFAVLYLGEECLGSARILRPGPSLYTLNADGCRTKILNERKNRPEIILGRNKNKMFRNKKEKEK
ncbi:unnamed protein product, partial [Meganyctiphanes norvegica]